MVELLPVLEDDDAGSGTDRRLRDSMIVQAPTSASGRRPEGLDDLRDRRGNVEAIASPSRGRLRRRQPEAAERSNGSYVINGQKTWISEAHVARSCSCAGRRERLQPRGMTMLEVPADAGASRSRDPTMGGKIVNDVFFTDCHVDAGARSGPRAGVDAADGGSERRAADPRRGDVGAAERAFDDLLAYVKERNQFGRRSVLPALRHDRDLARRSSARSSCASTWRRRRPEPSNVPRERPWRS